MPLCLSAGSVSAWLGIQAFTLAWMHSVEKIRWEEDWQVDGEKLRVVAARVRGSGAGMEPPLDAQFSDGVWHYRPAIEAQARVLLTHSPYVPGYEICYLGACRPLVDLLPGLPETTSIELDVCSPK